MNTDDKASYPISVMIEDLHGDDEERRYSLVSK